MPNDKLIKQCNRLMFSENKYKLQNKNVLLDYILTRQMNVLDEHGKKFDETLNLLRNAVMVEKYEAGY